MDTSEKNFEAALLGSDIALREDPAPYAEAVIPSPLGEGREGTGYVKRRPDQYDRALCLIPDDMERRLSEIEGLKRAMNPEVNPSDATRKLAFEQFFADTLEDMIDANFDLYKKIKEDETFADRFRAAMFQIIVGKIPPAQPRW